MFFPNGTYRNRVLHAADRVIHKHMALPREADTAFSAFLGVLKGDAEAGRLNLIELAKVWRAAKLTHEEAALGLIDGVVSRMKEVAENKRDTAGGMAFLIDLLEGVIEDEFAENPGRIAPVNGKVGAALTANLGGFIKPLR